MLWNDICGVWCHCTIYHTCGRRWFLAIIWRLSHRQTFFHLLSFELYYFTRHKIYPVFIYNCKILLHKILSVAHHHCVVAAHCHKAHTHTLQNANKKRFHDSLIGHIQSEILYMTNDDFTWSMCVCVRYDVIWIKTKAIKKLGFIYIYKLVDAPWIVNR